MVAAPYVGHVLVPQFVVGLHATSHLHDDIQSIVPQAAEPFRHIASNAPLPDVRLPHAPAPVHVTDADPAPVVIVPHAALPPLQLIEHGLTPPHDIAPQAADPEQVALPPPPSVTPAQLSAPMHSTSHWDEQLMLLHALSVPSPSHVMLHVPDVQSTFAHEFAAPHVSLHDSDCVQLMSPHAPIVGQLITQFQPAGHEIAPPPAPLIVQVFVWKLQFPWHTLGQIAASVGASVRASWNAPTTQ